MVFSLLLVGCNHTIDSLDISKGEKFCKCVGSKLLIIESKPLGIKASCANGAYAYIESDDYIADCK